jgi:hypothetical protein
MKSKFGSFWWERKTQKLTTPKNHKLCDITWNLVGKWNAPRSKGDPLNVTRMKHQTTLHDLSHSSDIRNTRIFRKCSKRSIFKYFKFWKCEYVKYVNTMNKTLSKLSLSCAQTQRQQWSSIFKYFLKSPKKCIIRVCLKKLRVCHYYDLSYLEVQVYFSRIVLQSSIYSNFCSM